MENKIKVFENKQVRTAWNADKEEWYFSVVDIVAVLTDSANPNNYWKVLNKTLPLFVVRIFCSKDHNSRIRAKKSLWLFYSSS